jgi:diacylglycerol kinase family enzyme
MFNACVDVMRRFPLLAVTLQAEQRAVALTTPFVFVGNNRYEMSLFSLGTRTSLQGGELSIYLTQDTGRMGLLRLFFRAFLGRLEQDRDFHSVMLPEVEIRTRRRFRGSPRRRSGADGVAHTLRHPAAGPACWPPRGSLQGPMTPSHTSPSPFRG